MLKHPFTPASPASRINHTGTYRRLLPVSLERMYENALDWEHLPHLHSGNFGSIRVEDAGPWGWRARVSNRHGQDSLLELLLDTDNQRWITRTLSGAGAGAEIWTYVVERGERELQITVDFFVPDVPEEAREKVGLAYATVYEQLYDEDVAMMTGRQAALDQRADLAKDPAPLERKIPVTNLDQGATPVTLGTRSFQVQRHGESWAVWPSHCPHQLGPLADLQGNTVSCPWHNYAFDLPSGECTTGQSCRLGKLPEISEADGQLLLRLAR